MINLRCLNSNDEEGFTFTSTKKLQNSLTSMVNIVVETKHSSTFSTQHHRNMSRKSTRSRNNNPDYNGDGADGGLEDSLFQYNKENCSWEKFNNDMKKDNLESDDDDDADIGADCTKRPASASSKTMRGTSAKRVSRSPQDEDDLEDNLYYDDDIDRNDEIRGQALPEPAEGDDAAPPVVDEGGDDDDAIGGNDAAPPVVDEGLGDYISCAEGVLVATWT